MDDNIDIMEEIADLSDELVTITAEILVLVVYDASGSMGENGRSGKPKYLEAEEATNGFIQRLKSSRLERSFKLGVATFNTAITPVLNPTSIANLPDEKPVTLPKPGGNTNIELGLKWAEEQAEAFMKSKSEVSNASRKVAIVLLSDGYHNEGADPRLRGKSLANRYTLGAGAFGDAAESLLKDLVSTPNLFKKDPTPNELRTLIEVSSSLATIKP